MLQKLNERIQGVVAWIIVSLVALTFTLFGLDYYLQNRHSDNVKVKINGHNISREDYELSYRRLSQMQGQNGLSPSQERELKQQVLSEMMVNAVSVEVAHEHGFEVDSKQTVAAIMKIPQFQEDGHFSATRYTQALSNGLFTPQTFQKEVQQGMLLNQQRFALIGTEFVLPTELAQFVSLSLQKRDYNYTVIKAADFTEKMHVTADEIQQYYETHKKQFMTKEQVSIDYIRLSLQALKNKINISSDQVAHYYEDNKNNYLTPARWQLNYVRFPVKDSQNTSEDDQAKQAAQKLYDTAQEAPATFSVLAKKAVKEKAQTGELPVIIAGQSDLDQYLVNLTEVGQISAPIRTKQGYEVLQLKSYKPAAIQPLAEVKTVIEEQLRQEAAQQEYADLEERLSELSYQNPDSLAPVADSLHVQLEHSHLFARGYPNQESITQHPAVMQAAFSHDVMSFGNNSEPIQLDADTLVVLRVKQHIPEKLQDVSQVKSLIETILLNEKASVAAQTYGKKLMLTAASTGLARAVVWHKINDATRDSEAVDPQINALAFAVSDEKGYEGTVLQNGDFAVVRLEKKHDGQLDAEDSEQTRNLTQQLEANYGLMDYDLYIAQLMAHAHITHY